MDEHKLMGCDCMSWVRKRYSRARFGALLIVIGMLWFVQKVGWFPPGIFGPLILLIWVYG